MPLPAGSRIGPYEVTGSLGEGGMGQVFRARDTADLVVVANGITELEARFASVR